MLACLLMAGLAVSARGATDPLHLSARLIAAAETPDTAELGRLARIAGTGGLLHVMRTDRHNRRLTLAVVAAAPKAPQSWALLTPLVELMGSKESALSKAAAASVLTIVEALSPAELCQYDHPTTLLAPPAKALQAIAADPRRDLALRATAILTLAYLSDLVQVSEDLVVELLRASRPQVRRSAVALVGARSSALVARRLAAMVARDPAEAVARAAAAELCATFTATSAGVATLRMVLREQGASARLRALVDAPDAERDELIDWRRCLRLRVDPEDRRVVPRLDRRLRRAKPAGSN